MVVFFIVILKEINMVQIVKENLKLSGTLLLPKIYVNRYINNKLLAL